MKSLKVVLIGTDRETTPPVKGGAIGTWVFEFAKELARRGHEVTIIGKPNLNIDYEALGINFVALLNTSSKLVSAMNSALHGNLNIIPNALRLAKVRELLDTADVVQAHYFTTSISLPLLCRKPLLVQFWHNIPKANLINKILAQKFDLVCGVSKLIAKKIVTLLRVNLRKVHVIYDFVDTNRFRPNTKLRKVYREKLGLEDVEHVLLYVGRIIPEKGLHCAILALKELVKYRRDVKLVVVGPEGHFDKPEYTYSTFCRRLISKFDLEKYVIWLGNVHSDEMPGIYNAADIIVISTMMEEGGVLLVTLEAMASGKPVIAYDSGALSEAIEHMRTGILVPKGDIHALSKAIKLLINDERLRLELAMNARRVCEAKFSVKVVVDMALKLYGKYLGG